jgi:hypothetical protein
VKRNDLQAKLDALSDNPDSVASFLLERSGLPGPRANLELAEAFSDRATALAADPAWLETILRWASISALEAPTNHPKEFLPFVAVQALGAVHSSCHEKDRSAIEAALRRAAHDPRWRMREACAFGLQRIGMASFVDLRALLQGWLEEPTLLGLRAVLAGLAHPPLLADAEVTAFAFDCAEVALETWLASSEGQTDAAKALRKALEFAPSVFVAADPVRGFPMLERWADRGRIEVAKIVAANLRKARLARHFPDEVQEVGMRCMVGRDGWDEG